MKMVQISFSLPPYRRGFHLITSAVLAQLPVSEFSTGMMQLFILHTSASLTLNENADPTVRQDFEAYFRRLAPEGSRTYAHNDEGDDDMPAHLKASLLGSSVLIPLKGGKLQLGTWQGIYLGEHRSDPHVRNFIATLWGES